jgi:hypothetical protein
MMVNGLFILFGGFCRVISRSGLGQRVMNRCFLKRCYHQIGFHEASFNSSGIDIKAPNY